MPLYAQLKAKIVVEEGFRDNGGGCKSRLLCPDQREKVKIRIQACNCLLIPRLPPINSRGHCSSHVGRARGSGRERDMDL